MKKQNAVFACAVLVVLAAIGYSGGTMHEDEILGGSGSVWLDLGTNTMIPRDNYTADQLWQHQHDPGNGKNHILEVVGVDGLKRVGQKQIPGCEVEAKDEVHLYIRKLVGGTMTIVTPSLASDGDIVMKQIDEAGTGYKVPGHRDLVPGLSRTPIDPKDETAVTNALKTEDPARSGDKDRIWLISIKDLQNYEWVPAANSAAGRAIFFYAEKMSKNRNGVNLDHIAIKRSGVAEPVCTVMKMPECAWFRLRKNDDHGDAANPVSPLPPDPDGRTKCSTVKNPTGIGWTGIGIGVAVVLVIALALFLSRRSDNV